MYIETQWINVVVGICLIAASCAFMIAQTRRRHAQKPWHSSLFWSIIPGLVGGMVVIAETPRLLGVDAGSLIISDMAANALGIVALLLVLRAIVILCFRLVRSVFDRMQTSATK
ncbi:hypothetical protein [Nocardiopsis sp. CC223A]|uniref:hypothetical protein n=1 Tax=Nocardiopsis sp. CC223A TaxID=3044051 RepID=UPI00278C3CCB|nr:hypothetical protein [Nocardiopsis sp. CC223A]